MEEEKTTLNFNKKDWINIIKKTNKDSYIRLLLHSIFENIEDISYFKESLPLFRYYSLFINLDIILNKHGFKKIEINGKLNEEKMLIIDFSSLEYEYDEDEMKNIEIEKDKFIPCLKSGIMLYIKNNEKILIRVEEVWRGSDLEDISFYSNIEPQKISEIIKEIIIYSDENHYLKGKSFYPDLYLCEKNDYSWDSIILNDNIKSKIKSNIENMFECQMVFKKLGIKMKRGVILVGNPGVGKTLIGKILSNSDKYTFIWITPGFLCSANSIKNIMEVARFFSPCLIFIEDIDLHGEDRDISSNRSLLGELMNQLDGSTENDGIAVVSTTNKLEVLEEALQNRPQRFDVIIEIPFPTEGQIRQSFTLFAKDFIISNETIDELMNKINKRKNISCAHIKSLVDGSIINFIIKNKDNIEEDILEKEDYVLDISDFNLEDLSRKNNNPIGFRQKENAECKSQRSSKRVNYIE